MKPLIVGLGHPLRRDDAAGLHCIDLLRHSGLLREIDLLRCETDLTRRLDLVSNRRVVVLVDAVDGVYPVGSYIRRISRPGRPRPAWYDGEIGSHSSNLSLCLAVLKRLAKGNPWVVLYGVQSADTGFGFGLSEAVLAACQALIKRIEGDSPWQQPELLEDTTYVGGWRTSTGMEAKAMHGFDWMKGALARVDDVARQGGLVKIERMQIAVGELSGYPVEELLFAFECLKGDTLCRNAQLEVETVPGGRTVDLLEVEGA